jgi:hypothetical protein
MVSKMPAFDFVCGPLVRSGGRDRVHLSRKLERDAIEAGYVEAWQHTNARRSPALKPDPERRPLPGVPNERTSGVSASVSSPS